MAATCKPILYSYYRSSCTWRVRIALAWKNVDYDFRAVHLAKGEQLSDDFIKTNPMKQIPALVINGITLTQSMAILEYLEEVYPDPPLLPKDPEQRAQVRAIAETVNSGIQPLQNLSVLKHYGFDKKTEWAQHFISIGFQALEEMLTKTSGKYCYGDSVTFADLFVVPQLYNANRFEVDMSPFPNIVRVCNNVSELGAFIKAHPSQQPDFPEQSC